MKTLFILDDDERGYIAEHFSGVGGFNIVQARCVEDAVREARLLWEQGDREVLAILDMMLPATQADLATLRATEREIGELRSKLVRSKEGGEPADTEYQAASSRQRELYSKIDDVLEPFGGVRFLVEAANHISGWRIAILTAHRGESVREKMPPGVRIEWFLAKPFSLRELAILAADFFGTSFRRR